MRAARVATPDEWLEPGWVHVEGERVRAVGSGRPPDDLPVAELGDHTLAPGFVDVHVHGGDGWQVNEESTERVVRGVQGLARFHARLGTTAVVPTTVSASPACLRVAVEGIARAARLVGPTDPQRAPSDRRASALLGADVLGCHLEGPWLSPARAGAQRRSTLRMPDIAELRELLTVASGTLRLLTVAPELPGCDALIDVAVAAGVTVSIGHTDADTEVVRHAFDRGARHVTHLFNAMTPVHHRRPGPAIAALVDERATLEIVADGFHVHPAVLALVARVAPGRVALVSDAVSVAGLAPGTYRMGDEDVVVEDGRVALAADRGVLAGSTLSVGRAVAVMVRDAGLPLLDALRAASATPAASVAAHRKGRLRPGCDADLVVLDAELTPLATVVRGGVCHDPTHMFRSVTGFS